ncbi:MAG: tyrosine--tRNA ligase, partial [Asticcacaulis sp.]
FNYMLMQATDFLELNRRYNCVLQMGGSDQWGNIVNGVELTRRMNTAPAFGLTTPLLTTASGAKMGKTASGAVWLNADMLSPYDYWQYWRNAEDRDVGRFLRLFTELPLDEIARLEALQGSEINEAKKVLADEATRMLHGAEAAATARDTAQKAFEQGVLSADLPTVEIPAADLDEGIMLAALATRIGLTASNGEARRLAQGGGLRVNDAQINDANQLISTADLNSDGVIKLSQGKKKILLVKPV